MSRSTCRTVCLIIFLALLCGSANAQSNGLALTVGGYFPVNSPIGASNAFAVGGSFAHRILGLPLVSAYVEVPVFATFNSTSSISQSLGGHPRYSTLFVTPGLKVKLAPEF